MKLNLYIWPFIVITILIAVSCVGNDHRKEVESNNIHEDIKVEHKSSQIQDSTLDVKSTLVKYHVLKDNFPIEKITSYEDYNLQEKVIGLVKIEFTDSVDGWNIEPNYNVLFHLTQDGNFCYWIISSSYPEDFVFESKSDNYIIFSYYSSSVGYSEYYVLTNDGLYKTIQFDESEVFDPKYLDLKNDKVGDKVLELVEAEQCIY